VLPGAASAGASGIKFTKELNSLGPLDTTKLEYLGNGQDQIRGPCPFLNSAANYNLLPYSGKKIHPEHIEKLVDRAGFGSIAAKFLGKAVGFVVKNAKTHVPNHPDDYMNLDDLRWHGIAHDLCMAHWDVDLPDQKPGDQAADPKLVDKMIQFCRENAKQNGQSGVDDIGDADFMITASMLGAWHHERVRLERERGHREPDTGLKTTFLGAGEALLVLEFIGRNGQISAAAARDFFVEGKFPPGWKSPEGGLSTIRTLATLTKLATAYELDPSWSAWFKGKWAAIKAGIAGEWSMFHAGFAAI